MDNINIFKKIFEIMDHFESISNNLPNEKKYKDDDDFFNFIFQNVKEINPNKNSESNPECKIESCTESNNESNNESNTESCTESTNKSELNIENQKIVKNYIRKCYKKIVLKCHPDKNKLLKDNKLFVLVQNYYDNELLIGILYIYYIANINPPEPLNNVDPNNINKLQEIIIEHIFKEIYIVQKKIETITRN